MLLTFEDSQDEGIPTSLRSACYTLLIYVRTFVSFFNPAPILLSCYLRIVLPKLSVPPLHHLL